ncbi:MAG TPA: hypothetical protein VHA74_03310 [Candidatus Dojkabacteria bacterium]|nr:hypothetical protein [Candidatus Dojkabacteria bacterium]
MQKTKQHTIESVGQRVDILEGKVESLEVKVDRLEVKFDRQEKRMDLLVERVIDIQEVIQKIGDKIDKLTTVMERHIKHTKQGIKTLRALYKNNEVKIDNYVENFEGRLQLLENPQYSLRDKPKK